MSKRVVDFLDVIFLSGTLCKTITNVTTEYQRTHILNNVEWIMHIKI